MDPLGLGLENFDSTGRWREVEATGDARAASFAPDRQLGGVSGWHAVRAPYPN